MNDLYIPDRESPSATTFIPNQQIIELLRIPYLHFHSENERNSSKFDEGIRTDFSNSFFNAVDEFSRKLRAEGERRYILINEL